MRGQGLGAWQLPVPVPLALHARVGACAGMDHSKAHDCGELRVRYRCWRLVGYAAAQRRADVSQRGPVEARPLA